MTRLEFLTYITSVFKRTDKNTEIYQALNDTIKDIAARHPSEAYSFQSWVPTVDGQEDYPLPTDLLHLAHPIRCLEGSATNDDGKALVKLTKEEYDVIEPNPNRTSPDTGEPWAYTIFSNAILLTDIPDDQGWILEINWGKIPTSLDDDGDTSSFKSTWDEILQWGSLWRLFAGIGMYDEANYWEQKYEDPLKGIPKMVRQDKDKKDSWIGSVANNSL